MIGQLAIGNYALESGLDIKGEAYSGISWISIVLAQKDIKLNKSVFA